MKAKRKAIEAKNKEIRLKNMRQSQAALLPAQPVPQISASQINFSKKGNIKDVKHLVVAKINTVQNKENSSNSVADSIPLKKPQKYTGARAALKQGGDGQALDTLEMPASFEKGEQAK